MLAKNQEQYLALMRIPYYVRRSNVSTSSLETAWHIEGDLSSAHIAFVFESALNSPLWTDPNWVFLKKIIDALNGMPMHKSMKIVLVWTKDISASPLPHFSSSTTVIIFNEHLKVPKAIQTRSLADLKEDIAAKRALWGTFKELAMSLGT